MGAARRLSSGAKNKLASGWLLQVLVGMAVGAVVGTAYFGLAQRLQPVCAQVACSSVGRFLLLKVCSWRSAAEVLCAMPLFRITPSCCCAAPRRFQDYSRVGDVVACEYDAVMAPAIKKS
jgi:hypothetical protein